METTVYLIRHSVRLNMKNNIESYNTTQESLIKSEKMILSYNGKIIFNKRLNSPEVFKLTLNEENNVKNIENIEFADLEFDDFNI